MFEKYTCHAWFEFSSFSFDNVKLKPMAVYPGLTVQYSTDGTNWKDVTKDTSVGGKIKLRTRSEKKTI